MDGVIHVTSEKHLGTTFSFKMKSYLVSSEDCEILETERNRSKSKPKWNKLEQIEELKESLFESNDAQQ